MSHLALRAFALVLSLLCSPIAFSQTGQSVGRIVLAGPLPPGDGMVAGAPYSATQEFEESQTLSDGTRIVHKRVSNVYRDFQGRMRLKLSMGRELPVEPNVIHILDPVNGVSYSLFVKTRVATRTPMGRIATQPAPSVKSANPPPPIATRERMPLGTQMIEGFLTQGVRTTNTVPVGTVGNDRPLTTVTETWYSDELKLVVLTRRSDPRSTTVNRLTNISRVEPSPALFEVPADYTIEPQNYQ